MNHKMHAFQRLYARGHSRQQAMVQSTAVTTKSVESCNNNYTVDCL